LTDDIRDDAGLVSRPCAPDRERRREHPQAGQSAAGNRLCL